MAGVKTKVPNLDSLCEEYIFGASVADIAAGAGVSPHILRRRFIDRGVMRNSAQASRVAFANGKMDSRRSRKGVPQSEEAKKKQSETMKKKWDGKARGWRINTNGYLEYTRGENVGKSFHVVVMEQWIGRNLRSGEIVHHIDGNKLNNEINNLALMNTSAHMRLHRREETLAGKVRAKGKNGKFERKNQCSK